MKNKIGILAFGSLIYEPGSEIKELEKERINCITPFKVEYSRISSTRGNAPTLIPISVKEKGATIKAVIIVLKNETSIEKAKDILWRRETQIIDKTRKYKYRENPNENQLIIKLLENFYNVEKVIYTSFKQQEKYKNLTSTELAEYSITSILSFAGKLKKDGIRYLSSAKKNNIITYKSEKYEQQILYMTKTNSLEEAIIFLDKQRESKK